MMQDGKSLYKSMGFVAEVQNLEATHYTLNKNFGSKCSVISCPVRGDSGLCLWAIYVLTFLVLCLDLKEFWVVVFGRPYLYKASFCRLVIVESCTWTIVWRLATFICKVIYTFSRLETFRR